VWEVVYNKTAMSYYTTYRPQTIEELDLVKARQALSAILTSGKFAQTYLFVGPKGTGKTSSARIVAKLLNCEKNRKQMSLREKGEAISKLVEPCNECENCQRITRGSSLACLEMDAASNRGIDDIRTLRERIGLAPAEGVVTVYIIDEVHMLTTEAFNALLKTLEEPPKHAVFILCTTDPQKIPGTVVSRCTQIQFTKATNEELLHSLNKAVVGEKLTVEDGALELIALHADGSFRDGMKMLEHMAMQTGGKILLDQVKEATSYGENYEVETLLSLLLEREAKAVLAEILAREEKGVDLLTLLKRLLSEVRLKVIAAVEQNSGEVKELLELAPFIDTTASQMKLSVLPDAVCEARLVLWCDKSTGIPEEKRSTTPLVQGQTRVVRQPVKTEVAPQAKVKVPVKIETKHEEVKKEKEIVDEVELEIDFFGGQLDEVMQKWQAILAAVRPLNHSLEALLRSARPVAVDNGILQIEAFYKFHKEQLEQDRHRRKLEEAMAQVLGSQIRLEFLLAQKGGTSGNKKDDNVSGAVEDDSLVKAAEEIFGN